MNQKEATEIIVNYLSPIFLERGYKYKKSRWFGFVKQYKNGFEHFMLSFANYWPMQQPEFLVSKRLNVIEDIYVSLVDLFDLGMPDDRATVGTFYFDYESLHFAHTNSFLKGGETEQDMLRDAKKIEEFMLEVGFPMLAKYDLKTIDAEINGDDFWETDWQKKFSLGGGFDYKRLIIAKLCNNQRFEKLYQFQLNDYKKSFSNYPEGETLFQGYNIYEYLVEVLLKDVKPLED